MHPSIPFYLATLSLIFVLPAVGQPEITTKFNLNPTSYSSGPRKCTTKNNEPGICIHKINCNNDHKIENGSRISTNELRLGSECNRAAGEWCCSFKQAPDTRTVPTDPPVVTVTPPGVTPPIVTPPIVTPPTVTPPIPTPPPRVTPPPTDSPPLINTIPTPRKGQKCIVTDQNDCPWFVKLFRNGETYPYCTGAMIGSKVILTSATCELQGRDQFLWATVPSSANPDANYTIITRLRHPKYSSGTRLNDLALFGLVNDIDWGTNGPKGACIDQQQTLGDECTAASLNEYDDLDVVTLFVTPGACTSGGNVSDAMCGNGLFEIPLPHGTPIMCKKNNMYMLSGITKRSYYPSDTSRALLGKLDYVWLINSLKDSLKLNDEEFLYSRNYN